MFDYLDYKNKIPLHKCVVEVPTLNPLSMAYEKFWIHTMKKKQIEGHWVEHNSEWKWIPGPIFQYTSLWTIERSAKGAKAQGKVLGKPDLRDIEWIKGFVHATARGFSGFQDDEKYTCHRSLIDPEFEEFKEYLPAHVKAAIYNSKGELKTYVDSLEYLYRYYDRNLGKPLYHNEAKNVADIECRNIGKTMISADFCAHNFLTDGVMDFDEWLSNYLKSDHDPTKQVYTTQTLLGAIDSKYSSNLASKIKIGLENLPGAMEISGQMYPAPLSKKTIGSWTPGKQIEAYYDAKIGGKWVRKGTGSGFLHRTFKDNEFAANGSRYGFGIIDEVGFMGNLLATLGQLHECTTVDGKKYGTIWMTGTGGDMDGGATEAIKAVFYSPASYDCLEFDDIFEGSPHKIGFFVPAWMALDEFRDDLGNVNRGLALRKLLKEREKASKAKTKDAINSLLQMKPLVPSEAFLVLTGNIFPVADLKEQLNMLETTTDADMVGEMGELVIAATGDVKFIPDLDNKLVPCDFPISKGGKDEKKKNGNNDGAVMVWERPDTNAAYGWYIAGCDPYNKDDAPNSVSVGSIFIIKRAAIGSSSYDKIVAEYTGRPDRADTFYENCRKLLLWYNGLCLYENNFNGLKTHFQHKNTLHLLAYTPTAIKANKSDAVSKVYGQYMNGVVKDEMEIYLRDWLTTPVDGDKQHLHYIYSKPLLKELIQYNELGNFDRVLALMMAIAQKLQMAQIVVEQKKEIKQDPFFARKLFTKNRR